MHKTYLPAELYSDKQAAASMRTRRAMPAAAAASSPNGVLSCQCSVIHTGHQSLFLTGGRQLTDCDSQAVTAHHMARCTDSGQRRTVSSKQT